jgi:hypothetical protein
MIPGLSPSVLGNDPFVDRIFRKRAKGKETGLGVEVSLTKVR